MNSLIERLKPYWLWGVVLLVGIYFVLQSSNPAVASGMYVGFVITFFIFFKIVVWIKNKIFPSKK